MKVWVTRDEASDGPLATALRAEGLEPVVEAVVTRRVVTDAAEEIARLGPEDWLVLTSVFAIEAVPAEAARVPRVAVVGEPSRRAALARGLRVELVGEEGAAAVFRALEARAGGHTVLYPRSAQARVPERAQALRLVDVVLYETVTREHRREVAGEVDVVAVASPSAVRAVGRVALPFASIGPTTSAALRELDLEPWVEAPEPTFEALARAIAGGEMSCAR